MSSVYSRNVFALWKRNAQFKMLLKPYRNDAFNIFSLNRSLKLMPMRWIYSRITRKSFIFFLLFFRFGINVNFHSDSIHTLAHTILFWVYYFIFYSNFCVFCWPTKRLMSSVPTILLSVWMDTVFHIFSKRPKNTTFEWTNVGKSAFCTNEWRMKSVAC